MNQFKVIIKESRYYALSKFFPGIFGLFFLSTLTRIIGIEEYGIYSLYMSQYLLIVSFSFGWLNQAELRYGYNKNRKFKFNINYFLISSFLIFVLINFFNYQYINTSIDFSRSFYCILSLGIFSYVKTIFQSRLLPKKVVYLATIQSISILILPLLINYFFQINSSHLLVTTAVASLFSTAILLITYIKYITIDFFIIKPNFSIIKKWLKYGFPISVWGSMGLLLPFLDRYFISHSLENESVGVYSAISELTIRGLSFLIIPISLAMHPRIINLWNNNRKKDAIQILNKSIFLLSLLIIIVALFILFFNDIVHGIFTLIIPSLPEKSNFLILPLVLSGLFWQLSLFAHKMIELNEKTYLMVLFLSISIIINLLGNILFLPKYGLIATAYTASLSAMSYCFLAISYFLLKKGKID